MGPTGVTFSEDENPLVEWPLTKDTTAVGLRDLQRFFFKRELSFAREQLFLSFKKEGELKHLSSPRPPEKGKPGGFREWEMVTKNHKNLVQGCFAPQHSWPQPSNKLWEHVWPHHLPQESLARFNHQLYASHF